MTISSMNYTTEDIENFFLLECNGVNTMKLTKLLYFAQGWHLALFDSLLFSEAIVAFRYGPTVTSTQQRYRSFGMEDIPKPNEAQRKWFDPRTNTFLEKIVRTYGHRSAVELSNMCHEDGTPWAEHMKEYGGIDSMHINFDLLKGYFCRLADEVENTQKSTDSTTSLNSEKKTIPRKRFYQGRIIRNGKPVLS